MTTIPHSPDGDLPAVCRGTIICYGDSITFAQAPEAPFYLDKETNWVARLARAYPDFRWINAGLNGRGMADVAGLRDALREHPEPRVVVVLLGTNDLAAPDPGCAARSCAALRELVEMVREQAPAARVVVGAPVDMVVANMPEYWTGERALGAHSPEELAALRAAYADYAAQAGLDFFSLAGAVPADEIPDGIHPDARGHARIAPVIGKAVMVALSRPR